MNSITLPVGGSRVGDWPVVRPKSNWPITA